MRCSDAPRTRSVMRSTSGNMVQAVVTVKSVASELGTSRVITCNHYKPACRFGRIYASAPLNALTSLYLSSPALFTGRCLYCILTCLLFVGDALMRCAVILIELKRARALNVPRIHSFPTPAIGIRSGTNEWRVARTNSSGRQRQSSTARTSGVSG